MPLLEFLAYYQVAEFFFPQYARQETIQRIRQHLRDPRFDRERDSDLGKLISLAAGGGKGGLSELEQLKATVNGCVDEVTLRNFIDGDGERSVALTGKDTIRGVKVLNLANKNERLSDQVATRLYEIRCRIVHAKEDGGRLSQPILLPFGEEAHGLRNDIDVARFIAQKVLVARATSSSW